LKAFLLATSLVLLIFSSTTASAQTPVAIEGLQVIAERQYAAETGNAIDTEQDGVYLVSARVYQFDSREHADSTWETLVSADVVAADIPEDDESISYETTELEDIGDRATVLSLSAEMEDNRVGAFRTMVIQEDAIIITVTVIAGSTEAATVADHIAIAMSKRNAGDSESTYDGTGKSTGGVWDIFLPADAEELAGLTAYADKETRPVQA